MGTAYTELACLQGLPPPLPLASEAQQGGKGEGAETKLDISEQQRMRNNLTFLDLVVDKIVKGPVLK